MAVNSAAAPPDISIVAVELGSVACRRRVLPAATTCDEVNALFHRDSEIASVIVATAQPGVVLVNRREFFQAMTGPLGYGRALHARRPVVQVMKGASEPLAGNVSLEAAAVSLVAAGLALPGDDVLVRLNEGWGTVPAARLYQQVAETHQRRATELAEREERFRSMVESSEDVIALLDSDGYVLYQSRDIEGLPVTPVGAHAFTNIFEDDAVELAVALQRLRRDPQRTDRGEFRVAAPNGSFTIFEYTARNLLANPAVAGIVVNYRDVTDRRAMEEELRHHAFHDPMTGLPNRELVFQRASHALDKLARVAGNVTLFYCDLDGFKAVNDALGHTGGDEVLVRVARRLGTALRRGDTLGRFGGDEFVVVAENCAGPDARHLAERIRRTLTRPLDLGGSSVEVGVSVGYASTTEVVDVATLVRRADAAMYVAKSQGRDQVVEYDHENERATARLERLRADLRLAATRGELHVAYQPIFDLRDEAMVGVEALLRWTHPTLGVVGPDEFIPIAESAGLVGRLGTWVLDEACRTMAEWIRRGMAPSWTSVNVSPHQLDDPSLVSTIAAVLDTYGLQAEHLHIELTETGVAEGNPARLEALFAIRQLGVTIALDDFGTGYSSLSSIGQLPIDKIKIDRSFVTVLDHTPDSAIMLEGIVELAHSLGYLVVAEGVERQVELDQLRLLGCDQAQGYLLSRPEDANQIALRADAGCSNASGSPCS